MNRTLLFCRLVFLAFTLSACEGGTAALPEPVFTLPDPEGDKACPNWDGDTLVYAGLVHDLISGTTERLAPEGSTFLGQDEDTGDWLWAPRSEVFRIDRVQSREHVRLTTNPIPGWNDKVGPEVVVAPEWGGVSRHSSGESEAANLEGGLVRVNGTPTNYRAVLNWDQLVVPDFGELPCAIVDSPVVSGCLDAVPVGEVTRVVGLSGSRQQRVGVYDFRLNDTVWPERVGPGREVFDASVVQLERVRFLDPATLAVVTQASGGSSRVLSLVDTETGQVPASYLWDGPLRCLSPDPAGGRLAIVIKNAVHVVDVP